MSAHTFIIYYVVLIVGYVRETLKSTAFTGIKNRKRLISTAHHADYHHRSHHEHDRLEMDGGA